MIQFPRAPLSPNEREAVKARLYQHANALLKLGIHIDLTGDFTELVSANRIAGERGGIPLMPLFNPSKTKIDARNGFAIIGRQNGWPVCTIAGIVRDVPVGLQDSLEDLSVLYDDVAIEQAPDAWCEVDAEGLNSIRGKVLMLGALWRDPLLKTIPGSDMIGDHLFALAILHGFQIHKPNYAAGIMAAQNVEWLGYDKEHFAQFHHGLRFEDPDWPHSTPDFRWVLVAMSRARMKAVFLGLPGRPLPE